MNELDPWVIRDKDGLQVWMGTFLEAVAILGRAYVFDEANWPFSLKQERIVAQEEVRDGTQVDSD